ncbi:MAG: InlB B-repeat-containing protein [Bacilli bacterium]|nr:InlB B-repeat-containing protein [Bacilli bacterium]
MIPDATIIYDDYKYINREEYKTQYLIENGDWLRVRDKEFNTLTSAYEYANAEDTIYVIADAYIGFEQELPSTKEVTLDLNGHNIIMTQTLKTYGTKTIKDSGTTGAITNIRDYSVYNGGTLTIEGGLVISNTTYGLDNDGALYVEGGTITGTGGLHNNGTATINGGNIIGTSEYAIFNDGTTITYGGDITRENGVAIYGNGGWLRVRGANITSSSTNAIESGNTAYTSMSVEVSGGEIHGKKSGLHHGANATLTISGGHIYGETENGVRAASGSATITGGILEGNIYGLYTSVNTTLGDNDRVISIDLPVLKGDSYGLYIDGGTFNFFDGILKGCTGAYSGAITNIADNSEIYTDSEDIDNKHYEVKYLRTETVIAYNKNLDKEYSNLQTALDEAEEDNLIVLLTNVPLYYPVTNNNQNGYTLNLNGYTISTNKPMTNTGRLTIISSIDADYPNPNANAQGTIKTSTAMTLLTNTNELVMRDVKLVNTSSSYYVLRNTGRLTYERPTIDARYGIQSTNKATLSDVNISATNTGIDNSGELTITNGTFAGTGQSVYTNATRNVIISGVTMNGTFYTNQGTVSVSDSTFRNSISISSGTVSILRSSIIDGGSVSNSGTTTFDQVTMTGQNHISTSRSLTIIDSDIDTYYNTYYSWYDKYGIDNSGTLELKNTKYKFDRNARCNGGSDIYGIRTSGTVLIHMGSQLEISSPSRTNNNVFGIYAYNNGTVTIRDEDTSIMSQGGAAAHTLYTASSGSTITVVNGIVRAINSPSAYGGYANYGKIILGKEESGEESEPVVVSQENPYVYAVGSTRGIAIKKTNGEFHFFDGILWGSRYEKPETTAKVQKLYEVTTYVDNNTGYEYAWLEYMGDDYQGQTVALLNGVYYTTLQDAINAFDYAPAGERIKLLKSITEDVQVPIGHSAIINLNGHSVTGKVLNYGTLQIYDGSLQAFEDTTVVNEGTLKIGIDDGNVSSTSVRIVSEGLAIANTGTVEFYDGYIEGNPSIDTEINKIADFSRIYTKVESMYERKYLQSLSEESIRNKETDLMLSIDLNNGEYYMGTDQHHEEVWSKENRVIWLKFEETYQLINPRKHACDFMGWEVSEEVIDENNLITMGLKDVDVKAIWQVSENAVARIGDDYFFTVEEALQAAKSKDTIEIIKDVQENVTVGSNKDVTINLNGHVIKGSFVNDGILTLLDGVIENEDGIGLINNKTLTIGINDGEIEIGKIQIIGTDVGLQQNGQFNFYDGFIEGDVAMNGATNSVPRGYFLYIEHNNIKDCQRVYLIGNPENAVAIITDGTTQYFFNLQDAIEAARINNKEIYIVKDFEAAYPIEVKEGYDITINMNSYNITTGNQITNNGTLKLYDDSETKGSINSARSITNNGTLTIEDIQLKQNKSVDTINNTGSLTVRNARINATDHVGIQNTSTGTLVVEDSIISSNSSNAINNAGTLTLTGDYELIVSSDYALANSGTITNELNSGRIVGIYATRGFDINDGVTITNSSNKPAMSLRAATYNFKGGIVTANSNQVIYTEAGNINFNISGGTYTANSATCIYVPSGTKTNFNITGGTFNCGTHGIDHRGDTATITIDNASIRAGDTGIRVVNSYSTLTLNSGTVYGGNYGIYFNGYRTVFTMTGGDVTGKTYDGFRDDYNSDNMTYTISGGSITGGRYGIYKYNDYLVIENATITSNSTSRDNYALYLRWGSTRLMSGARIIAERASGIWAEDNVTIEDGAYIYAGAPNAYGIAERWMNNFVMNGGTIETPGTSAIGIYSYEDVFNMHMHGGEIISGNVGLALTTGNNARTIEINGGRIVGKTYGIQQTSGQYTTTIGNKDLEVSSTVPYISGGLYGIYKTAGSLTYYNGRLRGKNFGYNENSINLVRSGKEITTYYEDTENVADFLTYSTTNLSSTATTNYAKSGNGYAKLTYLGETTDLCTTNQSYTYDYTGQEETFTTPCEGKYKIEVWGAQGGLGIQDNNKNRGTAGYGGYASGEITLTENEVLFINVGGKGANGSLTECAAGGYNGGGIGTNDSGGCTNPSDDDAAGGGGGATHIATVPGLLAELVNSKESIIIVAGGGGGAAYNHAAGSGGGFKGGITSETSFNAATQESGYMFGKGKDGYGERQTSSCDYGSPSCVGSGGGGGGYYGGTNEDHDLTSSGTGGSGYIGSSRLSNGVMYGYNVEATIGQWVNNYLIDKEAFLQVADQIFNTFDEASAYIEENGTGTITVLKDSVIEELPTIVGNRTITLDLNGHVITLNYQNIVNKSDLTVIDSSAEKTGRLISNNHRVLENQGNLTLNGVTISGQKSGTSTVWGSTGTGTITVKDSTIIGVHNSIICDAAQKVIIDNSTLTAGTDGIKMNTAGANVTVKSGTITASEHGIILEGASNSSVTIESGTINATNVGIYVLNANNVTLNYKSGTINAENVGIDYNGSNSSTIHIESATINAKNQGIYNKAQSNTWTIDTANVTSRESHAIDFATNNSNRNTLTITNGTYVGAVHGVVVHSTNATINGGSYSTTSTNKDHYVFHVESDASLTINDGITLTAENASGIYANEAVTLNGVTVNSGAANGYGIYHNSGNLTLTNCAITGNNGIESTSNNNYTINYTNSTIDASNVGIYINGTGTKTLNINSGTIDGEVIGLLLKGNNTTTNLGIKDEVLSVENPHIISDNIAVMNSFGILNFNSGLLTATSRVLTAEPTELRQDKEVHYDYTINEGVIATLTSFNHTQTPTSDYAKEGNGSAKITYLEYDSSSTQEAQNDISAVNDISCNEVVGTTYEFEYVGAVQEFKPKCPGQYKLEVWGAQGGYRSSSGYGGKGGYSAGTVTLTDENLYIYVGSSGNNGGWNGGGTRAIGHGGGGATDIRLTNSLYSRIIVAGGGGSDGASNRVGGYGGGTTGGQGGSGCGSGSDPGTQTAGGNLRGTFGQGGSGNQWSNGYGGAGGGGWYGGGGVDPDYSVDDDKAGGGGSGFVYTATATIPASYLVNSNYYLTDTKLQGGNETFKSPSGSNETGHVDNGYARITFVSQTVTTTVSVEYDAGIGELVNNTIQYTKGTALGELPVPTVSSNYTFDGWYTSKNFNNKVSETTIINIDTKLYAKYIESNIDCNDLIGHEWKYEYTNMEESFITYCPGKYKLEVWGASGGYINPNTKIGYGGYSVGELNLIKNDKLYINIGSQGYLIGSESINAGYNGGGLGSSSNVENTSGGGATHIATKSGLLSDLSDYRDSVLIVAGGGGGAGSNGIGGSGGGYIGGDGLDSANNAGYFGANGTGGTATEGGKVYNLDSCKKGAFGQGANLCSYQYGSSGGGGGYFGGGGSNSTNAGAGGGSGYINNTKITNGHMYGYNVPSTGHGVINAYLSSKQGFLEVDGNTYSSFDSAITAIQNNSGTIKVLNHVIVRDVVSFPSEYTINLDLNGYEISFTNTITNEANLTISNSSQNISSITNTLGDVINNKGTITINNVQLSTGASYSCIRGTTGNGTITLANNSLLAGGNGIIEDVVQNITINDSSINVGSYGIKVNKASTTINVTNSLIKSGNIGVELTSASNTLTITGSTLDTNGVTINVPGGSNEVNVSSSDISTRSTAVNVTAASNTVTLTGNSIDSNIGVSNTANYLTLISTNNNIIAITHGITTTGNNCSSTINNNRIKSNTTGINHRGTSNTMSIDESNIEALNTGVYHTGNSSNLTIEDSDILSTGGNGILDDTSSDTTKIPMLTLKNTNVTGKTNGVNLYYCNSNVTGGEIKTTSTSKEHFAYISSDWSTATMTNAFINAPEASGCKSNGAFVFNNSRVYAGNQHAYGIYANFMGLTLNNTVIETPDSYAYGIYSNNVNSDCNINFNSGSITSGYIGIGLYNSYSKTKTLNIKDGTVKGELYGIYQSQASTTVIGDSTEANDIENPFIYGGINGMYIANGTVSFYSGRLKGTLKAYDGVINTIRDGYEIFEDNEEMSDFYKIRRTYSTTDVSSEAVSNKAKSGNGYVRIKYEHASNAEYTATPYQEVNIINESTNCGVAIGTTYEFEYTGNVQEFTALCPGEYKIEVWGAQGGYRSSSGYGGKGGYSAGTVSLSKNEKVNVYVGSSGNNGGWNGGGTRAIGHGGGGATDVRLTNSLYSRIIVAGGGGSDGASNRVGGYGGGTTGGQGGSGCGSGSDPGTQTAGGNLRGKFGQGGSGNQWSNGYGGAGGGGWYGGGGVDPDYSVDDDKAGGGGSGFVFTEASYNNWFTHATDRDGNYSIDAKYYLKDTSLLAGNQSFTSPTGTTETGHTGNGYARITLVNNNVKVELDAGIGTVENGIIEYEHGDELGELPIPTVSSDCEFVGWFLDRTYTQKVTSTSIIDDSVKLYAKYNCSSDYCDAQATYEFDYNGKEQSFITPCSGVYTLEVWGASGGGNQVNGSVANRAGAGGYSHGQITLTQDEILYINIGGHGFTGTYVYGGTNGGGKSGTYGSNGSGSGGGATHIATKTGLLSTFTNDRDSVIIVAGGGGGSDDIGNGTYNSTDDGSGGSGGGYIGGHPTIGGAVATNIRSGEQDVGYAFGQGQDATNSTDTGGGGGGWYGGYSSGNGSGGGSGGSGYVGNSRLSDTYMYVYNGRTFYPGGTFTIAYLVPATDKIKNVEQDKTYTNVQDAFSEVQDGETLQLTRETSISYDVTIPNKVVTLDLNGYDFITNKSLINNGTLTILDSTNTQDIELKSTVSNTLINNKNTLIVTGLKVSGYDIINSAEEGIVELTNVQITGHNIVKSTTDGNITITNSTLEGSDVIAAGLRTPVTINNSVINSSNQAVNTNWELNISDSTITGNTYGIYTNTAEDVNISNTKITASKALYNNSQSTITISNNCELRGEVNNANANGTLNMNGGLINGPLGNSGRATLEGITMTYTYDSYGSYSFINNSGTLIMTSDRVETRNNNGSGPGTNYVDRIIYNTGTVNSTSSTYIYTSPNYTNRLVRGVENRGIFHSSGDTYTLSNRHYIRAIENVSTSPTSINNATVSVTSTHQGIAYYNPGSGTLTVTGGNATSSGVTNFGMYIEGSGEIISENVNYTITGSNDARIAHSAGGNITYRSGTSTITGPTSYCLSGHGNKSMLGGSCTITSSTTAYGMLVQGGTGTINSADITITASSTAYGVKNESGTSNVESGNIIATAPTAYGVHMSAGTMTIGIYDGSGTQQGDISQVDPHIEARGSTTGIGSSMGNGTLNFYDGKIIGSTRARAEGDITSAVEKNWQVATYTDEETGYQYCILEFIM